MKLVIVVLALLIGMYFFRKKFPILQKPGAYFLIPLVLFSPVAFFGILFGLAGANKGHFALIVVGYLISLGSAYLSLRKPRLMIGAAVGMAVLIFGSYKSSQFWKHENENLCAKLRADPYCVESTTGFNCSSKSSLGGFSSANVCSSLMSEAELDKVNAAKKTTSDQLAAARGEKPDPKLPNLQKVGKANDVYIHIVKQIIEAQDPARLNFESQLTAIYNCINGEFADPLKAEAYATMNLRSIAKTPEQIEKYRSYASSKGRNMNPSIVIAALPAGDSSLNCTTLIQNP
ncbi:MAG: hypothetical protein EOP09_13340 [Proteobacteria bacterium]|nr:MAG: hypothetical protein EOP09_13340 [Pseudomonadota bacterium]